MQYWLLKSEPSSYSWQDMKKDKITQWDGVRNFQARNFMKQMHINDLCFFYESSPNKCIAGVVKVIKNYYLNEDSDNFGLVDVEYLTEFKNSVHLNQIKNTSQIQDLLMLKQPRLSIMPVSEINWQHIIKLQNA